MTQKKLTFLGTGTSQGVPIIGCDCEVCMATTERDKRLRTSAVLEVAGKTILFDSGADFRQQMLTNGIRMVDCVLFTHEHRDHTAGLDELRPMTWNRETPIPIYAEQRVMEYLRVAFPHIMGENKYPGGAKIQPFVIDETPFELNWGMSVIPIRFTHFEQLPILGYRIENMAYLTDCKSIDEENLNKLKGLETLVINALGKKTHPSHLSLGEALEIISYLQPNQAYITHIGHTMGLHDEVQKELPPNVFLAYDGLVVEF